MRAGALSLLRRAAVLLSVAVVLPIVVSSPARASDCPLKAPTTSSDRYVRARTATAPVVVYGDSITYQTQAMLPSWLGYDARWGRTTEPTVNQMQTDVRGRAVLPEAVVMAIGTNDVRDPSEMPDLVKAARRFLPTTVRLLWVNTFVATNPGYRTINEAIASVPGVQVVDWAAVNRASLRAKGSKARLLDSSGVHVSCRGGWVRSALIVRAAA